MALSTKDLANEIGTSPRVLRKFLRASELGVGQGSRYEFDSADVSRIRAAFGRWSEKRSAPVVIPDDWADPDDSED